MTYPEVTAPCRPSSVWAATARQALRSDWDGFAGMDATKGEPWLRDALETARVVEKPGALVPLLAIADGNGLTLVYASPRFDEVTEFGLPCSYEIARAILAGLPDEASDSEWAVRALGVARRN